MVRKLLSHEGDEGGCRFRGYEGVCIRIVFI